MDHQPAVDFPRPPHGRPCSVASALQLVGDRWALLVVRELLLGNHRFDELARNTGAPRDRLAARLRDLESAGVIERRRYQERPTRYEYHLTEAGSDLGTVIQALRAWGDRWAVAETATAFRHSCGEELAVEITCPQCGPVLSAEEIVHVPRTPGWDAHGPVDAAGGSRAR